MPLSFNIFMSREHSLCGNKLSSRVILRPCKTLSPALMLFANSSIETFDGCGCPALVHASRVNEMQWVWLLSAFCHRCWNTLHDWLRSQGPPIKLCLRLMALLFSLEQTWKRIHFISFRVEFITEIGTGLSRERFWTQVKGYCHCSSAEYKRNRNVAALLTRPHTQGRQ